MPGTDSLNHPPAAGFCLLGLLASTALQAQVHTQNSPQPSPVLREPLSKREQIQADNRAPVLEDRLNQRIERLRVEDEAVVIDELRVGGQSQRLTVQPKGRLPAYQVLPGGTRVWNFLSF
jgi:hypothetical protein